MPSLERARVSAFRLPLQNQSEADGTLIWDATELLTLELETENEQGLAYIYAHPAAAYLLGDKLLELLDGEDFFSIHIIQEKLLAACRNMGTEGIASSAISAVDIALWDLKSKCLGVSLVDLWGRYHERMEVYGSGGFLNFSDAQIHNQHEHWKARGISRYKFKIGLAPNDECRRLQKLRSIIGDTELYVDANGAYDPATALEMSSFLTEQNIHWFEEPVSSDDLKGLSYIRQKLNGKVRVVAGEYAWAKPNYFRQMLSEESVDILQADISRCGGYSGFLRANEICRSFGRPLTAHCSPGFHLPVCLASSQCVSMELFWDHEQLERKSLKNFPQIENGSVKLGENFLGHGLEVCFDFLKDYGVYRKEIHYAKTKSSHPRVVPKARKTARGFSGLQGWR